MLRVCARAQNILAWQWRRQVDDSSALPLLRAAHQLGLPEIRDLAFRHVLDHATACLGAAAAPLPPPDDDEGGGGERDDGDGGKDEGGDDKGGEGERVRVRGGGGGGGDDGGGYAEAEPLGECDPLEELCGDMPELAAALIRALVAEKTALARAASGRKGVQDRG